MHAIMIHVWDSRAAIELARIMIQTARSQPGRDPTFFGASFNKRLGAILGGSGGVLSQNPVSCTHPP